MKTHSHLADELLQVAQGSGFALAGFTGLHIPEKDRHHLEAFIGEKRFGEMLWFEKHQHLRLDPAQLLTSDRETERNDTVRAESALVLGMIYVDRQYEKALADSRYRIARYAVGRDYHRVFKKRAKAILDLCEKNGIRARLCVDSAPLPEKVLARMAGLGWQGKHTNLIHPQYGSFFFLGVVLLSAGLSEFQLSRISETESERKPEMPDLCGRCNLCVDACPTGALEPYRIDARKCLSYITIESKNDRHAFPEHRERWVFGCDICQEVCPYNRSPRGRRSSRTDPELAPRPVIYEMLGGAVDERLWNETAGMALRRISLDQMQLNYSLA